MNFDAHAWTETLARLQQEIPDFAYAAWIAPLAAKISPTSIVLGCPSSFHRDRVRIQYLDALERNLEHALKARAEDESVAASVPSTGDDGTLEDRLAGKRVTIEILTMTEFATRPGHVFSTRSPVHSGESVPNRSKVMLSVREPAQSVPLAADGSGGASLTSTPTQLLESSGSNAPYSRESIEPAATSAGATARSNEPSPTTTSPTPSVSAPGSSCVSSPLTSSETQAARLRAVPEPKPASTPTQLAPVPSPAPTSEAPKQRRTPSRKPRRHHEADPAQPELPFSFESFIVGPCNALAREAALALARKRQESLNLLYLAGESGMGKTHLARATASEARRQGRALFEADPRKGPSTRRPGGILYTTADQFTSEFVSAMRNGRSEEFKRRYRGSIDLLVVEDIQAFSGRVKTQLELFNTVGHVLDAGGRVLLTGDRSPRELSGLDERMRAQVAQGFVAELDAPDAIVRRHILRTKADAGGVRLPNDCLDLLVEVTRGSVREIESMLIQVVTTASLLGKPIDLDLTQDAVSLKTSKASVVSTRTVEVSEIVKIVAAFFGKRPEALAAKSRRRDVLVPRQLAMYLAHRYCEASFAEIGRALGRGHPSVRNAVARIERQVLENAPLRYQVEALSERIDQTLASR